MKTIESILTNYSGAFPNTLAVNSTGPATTDGSEYVADFINNYIASGPQILLDYASVTPNGITESVANSQYIDALKKGFGIGPGVYKIWGLDADPAVSGHRVLLLQGQGILRAAYLDLDAAVYVGDPSNPTAPYFYHADDAAGTIRNVAGAYLILPPGKQLYKKSYSQAAGDFTVTGTNWTTYKAELTPYQNDDGSWWLEGNISGGTSTVISTITLAISGVTFDNFGTYGQPINYMAVGSPAAAYSAYAISSTGNLTALFGSHTTTTDTELISFNVKLASAPTWIDGFNYPLAITY